MVEISSTLFQEESNSNHQNHETYMGSGCLRGEREDYAFQELQHMDERTHEAVVAGEEESGGDGMIEMGKKYQTRDGRAVRILCVDGNEKCWPIVGFIGDRLGVDSWSINGLHEAGKESASDLIPVPTKHAGWGVIRMRSRPNDISCIADGVIWDTKQEAERYLNKMSMTGAILACVTWED